MKVDVAHLKQDQKECFALHDTTAEKLRETSVILDRVVHRLDNREQEHNRMRSHLWGQDPTRPGLSMRVDRIEEARAAAMRRTNYLTGGSVIGILAIISLLVKIWMTMQGQES